jgi:hypothetical protein
MLYDIAIAHDIRQNCRDIRPDGLKRSVWTSFEP